VHCTAVKIHGGDLPRLGWTARVALELGLEASAAGPVARPPPRTESSAALGRDGGANPATPSPMGAACPSPPAGRSASATHGRSPGQTTTFTAQPNPISGEVPSNENEAGQGVTACKAMFVDYD
jgi:hypothetical protein